MFIGVCDESFANRECVRWTTTIHSATAGGRTFTGPVGPDSEVFLTTTGPIAIVNRIDQLLLTGITITEITADIVQGRILSKVLNSSVVVRYVRRPCC